jgi:hypothetical protein
MHYELRPGARAKIAAMGLHQDAIARREGIARFRLDLREKGQLAKGPQAWKFAPTPRWSGSPKKRRWSSCSFSAPRSKPAARDARAAS